MRIEIKEKRILKNIISKRLGVHLPNNINGIAIDSREIKKGDMFLALKGEKYHGADFINKDILDKLNLIISDKPIDASKAFLVKNSNEFLKDITSEFRKTLRMKIIGVTGTNGKTSTKELLVRFLKTKFSVSYSEGNYNSTISLPLSMLACDSNADYCVLEMGASKKQEIKFLCDIAKPDIGVITNISESHLEGYSNFSQLISTKLALYDSVIDNNGMYFLNKDDANINIKDSYKKIVTYSYFDDSADYFADMSQIKDGLVCINDYSFGVPYKSLIFALNFLASFSIASSLGVDNQRIQDSLLDFQFPNGRGRIVEKAGSIIIDDTYNANLSSMKSGISDLALIKKKGQSVIVILGDMLDLGKDSERHHSELGRYIGNLDFIDSVFCLGETSSYIIKSINNENIQSLHFNNTDAIVRHLKEHKFDNNIFYFKGSRGMSMEKIIHKVFN